MDAATRREFIKAGALAAAGGLLIEGAAAPVARAIEPIARPESSARLKLSLAAYSFRKFLELSVKTDRWSIFDFIEKSASYGTEGVELTQYYFEKPITAEYVSKIKHKAHVLGQAITGTPVGNSFTAPAGEERDKQLKHVKNWIDVSADLGSPCIRIFAGGAAKGQSDTEARKNVVECIESLCGHADKRGVFLAVENHGGVVATAEGLLEIIKA